ERVIRRLHHGDATRLADGEQSARAVVEHSRQQDADAARTVDSRRTAEQRVDRGPVAVLGGAVSQLDIAGLQQEMDVGRCDINHAWFRGLAVTRGADRQPTGASEDLRQGAVSVARQVEHDEHAGAEAGWEGSDQAPECFYSAS